MRKYKTGGPFDPTDWDVDAFIVDDELFNSVRQNSFRDARNDVRLKKIADELEIEFKNLSGYRDDKPFTFIVWTEALFNQKVKPFGYKLLE